jgi:acyl-CoA thioester hydrolase
MDMELYRGLIFPWQCDHMGHMNVMYYVHAFDQAFGGLLAEAGFTPAAMRETTMGFADVKHEIEYRAEQRAGDRIVVTGGFSRVGNSSAQVKLTMTNPDTSAVAAVTTITSVHFDLKARRSAPIPDEVRARIGTLMVGASG